MFFMKNYTCDLCGNAHDAGFDVNGNSICEDCTDESTIICSVCNRRTFLPENRNNHFVGDSFVCSERCRNHHPDFDDGSETLHWRNSTFNYFTTKNKDVFNTKDFTIGVEIECLDSDDTAHTLGGLFGLSPEQITVLQDRVWSGDDGSVDGDGNSYEFRTLPSSNNEFNTTIKALTDMLSNNGFHTNRSCGLHIHIGEQEKKRLTNANRYKIYVLYAIYKKLLFKLVKGREGNSYCDSRHYKLGHWFFWKQTQREPERIINGIVCTRYSHINTESWARHSTIEIRMHHGTIDYEEITNWVKLNTIMFDWACKNTYSKLLKLKGGFEDFERTFLNGDESLKAFFTKRYKYAKNKRSILLDNINQRKVIKEEKKRYSMNYSVQRPYNNYLLKLAEIKQ